MLKWLRGVGNAREPKPRRVAVIDATTVDGRRRLVLIRRDNVEHLMMIGGPSDVLIEPNIIRATGAREPTWPAAPGPARLAGELSDRLTPPEVPLPPARSEMPRIASPLMEPPGVRARMLAPPEEPAPPQQTIHNLEEIKRELEAALRGSPAPQGPPVTDPLTVPPPPTLLVREPKIEPKFEPPKPVAKPKSKPEPPEKPPEPEPQVKD